MVKSFWEPAINSLCRSLMFASEGEALTSSYIGHFLFKEYCTENNIDWTFGTTTPNGRAAWDHLETVAKNLTHEDIISRFKTEMLSEIAAGHIDDTDADYETPLLKAICYQNMDMVVFLVEHGAKVGEYELETALDTKDNLENHPRQQDPDIKNAVQQSVAIYNFLQKIKVRSIWNILRRLSKRDNPARK